jgi:hypothetical protein
LTGSQAFTKPMPVASYEPATTVVCMATAARFLPGDLSDGLVSASAQGSGMMPVTYLCRRK